VLFIQFSPPHKTTAVASASPNAQAVNSSLQRRLKYLQPALLITAAPPQVSAPRPNDLQIHRRAVPSQDPPDLNPSRHLFTKAAAVPLLSSAQPSPPFSSHRAASPLNCQGRRDLSAMLSINKESKKLQ
jgi:hypothetical protein